MNLTTIGGKKVGCILVLMQALIMPVFAGEPFPGFCLSGMDYSVSNFRDASLIEAEPVDHYVLLALTPSEQRFQEVCHEVSQKMGKHYRMIRHRVDGRTSLQTFEGLIQQHNPDLLLIMDNPAAELYGQYQERHPDFSKPALISMVLLADQAVQSIRNAEAISYEVPAARSLKIFGEMISKPLEKVGVLYDESFHSFFQDQARQCEKDGIQLVGQIIPHNGITRRNILNGLKHLIKQEKVDGLWIISDNQLLTNRTLESAWIPMLRGFRKPVVVGVETLLSRSFGNFAAFPEPGALANQIGNRIHEIQNNGWKPPRDGAVFGPAELKIVVLEKYAAYYFGLDLARLGDVSIESR